MNVYKKNKLDLKTLKKYFYLYIIVIAITLITTVLIKYNSANTLQDSMTGRISFDSKEGNVFLYFIYNNGLKVPLLTFLIALIPIPYLFTVVLISNGILLGLALSIPISHPNVSFIDLFLGIGFNSMFEQIAILITVMCASYINKFVCKKLYFKKKYIPLNTNLFDTLKLSFKIYILYAIPLFVIAAIIEAYIVPILN